MSTKFIYIVESDGRYKIGIASDVGRRIKQIRTVCPHNVNLVYCVNLYNCARDVEKLLHDELKKNNRHIHGEWFFLHPDQISALKETLDSMSSEYIKRFPV